MMYTICFSFKKHGIISFLRRIQQLYNAVAFIHGNNYLKYILSHLIVSSKELAIAIHY